MEHKKDFAKVFMIAGSEPLGCCGIQADIKAVSACGGFAAGATTLLVDMNTTKVKGIRTMPVDIILSQSRDFLDDVGADCIKTGMLYEKQIVEAVAGLLREYPEVPKVIDPVMVDSGGTALILQEAIDAYRELLFPQAEIITPNIHEARVLAGEDITLDNVDRLIRKISEDRQHPPLLQAPHRHPQRQRHRRHLRFGHSHLHRQKVRPGGSGRKSRDIHQRIHSLRLRLPLRSRLRSRASATAPCIHSTVRLTSSKGKTAATP